jgi:PAS domain S-box-containing protein
MLDGLKTAPGSLARQGLVLLCWIAVLALSYIAWRRRRGEDVTDLLVVGGLLLALRLGLLVAGLPRQEQPGDASLAAALDLTGLVLLVWPFLAPPLPASWADRLAGAGLLTVALTCGVALWQRVCGTLGLYSEPPFSITWGHSALVMAGLAGLNLLHVQRRRRDWLLTMAGSLLAGIGGLLFPLPTASPLSAALTAVTAVLAAAWLNRLERPQREMAPVWLGSEVYSDTETTVDLLAASTSLLATTDLAGLLPAVTAALRHILEIRAAALLLPMEGELTEHEKTCPLKMAARWPYRDRPETLGPVPGECKPILAEILARGAPVHLTQKTDAQRLKLLESILGAELEAALILPLSSRPPERRLRAGQGLLVLDHGGDPLGVDQLELCRILADQVAIAANTIQLRTQIGQQSRALDHLAHRQDAETGRLHAILGSIADGVVVSDANDQVVLTNDAALNILGAEQPDILGQPFGQILGRMVPAGDVGIIGTLTESSPYGTEAVFEVGDRVVETSMIPIENSGPSQLGVVAVLRDITDLATAEAERERLLTDLQEHNRGLEETAERLQELDKLKSQFIANVSHELRTPLNSIIGFSGVMLKEIDGTLTEAQHEDIRAIYTSGKHLLGLITNLLDIGQIWADKMELTLSKVDLAEVVEDAATIALSLIGDKPIQLVQTLDPDLPTIWADRTRVRQILLNLFTNAIKYTEQGQVTVSASRDNDAVIISVADTGIGIPPEHQDTIFEAFGRVDNSNTRKVDGMGLGLSISRQLVELQGGQIWVESDVGVGSTFHFSLPLEGPPSSSADRKVTHQRLEAALAQWQ